MKRYAIFLLLAVLILFSLSRFVYAQSTSDEESSSFWDKIINFFNNLTKKDVSYLNKLIAQKYDESNSFSYEFDEMNYIDKTKREFAFEFKRPDMIKTESEGIVNICNKNSYYTISQGIPPEKTQEAFSKCDFLIEEGKGIEAKECINEEMSKIPQEELIHENKYTNLPAEIESYCSWAIDNGLNKFLIFSDSIDSIDNSKYKMGAVKGRINGRDAIIIKYEPPPINWTRTSERYAPTIPA